MKSNLIRKILCVALSAAMVTPAFRTPVFAETELVELISNGSFENKDSYSLPEEWDSNGENLLFGGDFESGENALKNVGTSPTGKTLRWASPKTDTATISVAESAENEKENHGNRYAKLDWVKGTWGGLGYPNMTNPDYLINAAYGGEYIMRADYRVSSETAFPLAKMSAYYLVTTSNDAIKNVTQFEKLFADSSSIPSTEWQTASMSVSVVDKPTTEGYTYFDIPHINRFQFRYDGKPVIDSEGEEVYIDNVRFEKLGRATEEAAASGQSSLKIAGYADTEDEIWESASVKVEGGEEIAVSLKAYADAIESYTVDSVAYNGSVKAIAVFDDGTEAVIADITKASDNFEEFAKTVTAPAGASELKIKIVFTGKGTVYIDDVSAKAEREIESVAVPPEYKNALVNGGFESYDSKYFPTGWDSESKNLVSNGDFENESLVFGMNAAGTDELAYSGYGAAELDKTTGTYYISVADNMTEDKAVYGDHSLKIQWKAEGKWAAAGVRNDVAGVIKLSYENDYIIRASARADDITAFAEKNYFYFNMIPSYLNKDQKANCGRLTNEWQEYVYTYSIPEKVEGYELPHANRIQWAASQSASAGAIMYVDNISIEKTGRTSIEDKATGERALKIDGYLDNDGKNEVWKSAETAVKGGEDVYFGLSYKKDNITSGSGVKFVFTNDKGGVVSSKVIDFGTGSKGWSQRTFKETLPENASGAYVEIYVNEGKGTLWADDVFVSVIPDVEHENVIVPDGITNAIENNGFEAVDGKNFPTGFASDGKNLVVNGDFEEDAYWYRAGASAGVQEFSYSDDSKDGTRSGNLKWVTYPVTGTEEWACIAYREGQGTPPATAIPVAFDSEYIVTMDAKKEGNIKNGNVTVMAELKNGENVWNRQTLLSATADEEWDSFSANYKTPAASEEKNGNNPDVTMGYIYYVYAGRSVGTAIEPEEGTTQVFVDNITIEKLSRSVTDEYKSGEKSLKIVGYSDGVDEVWESESELTVSEGEEIYYGGSLKMDAVKANARFKVNFYDEDGVFVSSDEFVAGRGTKDWTEYTDSVIAPDGAKAARLALVVGNGNGTAWFDDVILGKMVEGVYTSKPVFNFDELAVNAGKTLKADAKVYNFEDATDIMMSVAIYDGNDLVAVGSDYKNDVSGEVSFSADVVIPDGEYADIAKLVAKCFIWDIKAQKPIRNPEAIPGSKTDGGIVMSTLYCDNMVFQRNEAIKVSGSAVPGAAVEISFAGEKKNVTVQDDGSFSASFQERDAGGPYSLTVQDNRGHKKVFKNVMVGEVWIVSGQSNMHYTTSYFTKLGDVTEDNENIRLFTVSKAQADEKVSVLESGEWKECTKATANGFSCIGYLLAKDLSKEMPGVAIGIIDTSYAGSDIGEWMEYETAVLTNVKTAGEKVAKRFNAMVYPLKGFNYRGVAWYQGESSRYWTYQVWLEAMVKNWRSTFGNNSLDFAIVQLPGFNQDGFAMVRESQRMACLDDENMHLSVNIDLGDKDDVHPHDKDILTERLANVIKKEVYGKNIDCYGPTFKSVSFASGKIVVSFDNAKELKTTDGKAPTEFIIAGADGVFYVADAVINGTTVELSSESVPNPIYVRHAFEGFPRPNLTDETGLPAEPFRTDSIDKVYPFEG